MLKADTNGILWCFTDISKSRGEAPAQPQLNFPKTLQEDWNRSFKGEWYAVHPWLEYSISEDSTSNKQKRQLCKMIYMDLPTLTDSLTHSHTHTHKQTKRAPCRPGLSVLCFHSAPQSVWCSKLVILFTVCSDTVQCTLYILLIFFFFMYYGTCVCDVMFLLFFLFIYTYVYIIANEWNIALKMLQFT